jgi:hypothetical protein
MKPWLRFGRSFIKGFVKSLRDKNTTKARDLFIAALKRTHKDGHYRPKSLADIHLNISFGWKPFLADVERVRKLQAEAGRPVKHHYRRYLDLALLPPTINLFSDSLQTIRRETLWRQKPTYAATVEFNYTMPDMGDMMNQVEAYLDSLGFQLNPRILWDAIPYSFVVDWFFDVGGWLASLRHDNLKVPCNVTGFCHSLKWEWQAAYRYDRIATSNPPWSPDRGTLIAIRSGLRYERRRDIPSWGLFSTTVRVPSWGQIALGGSLTVQKL